MRWLFGAMLVLALGVMGCSETTDPNGTGGDGGAAGVGGGGVGGDGGIGGDAGQGGGGFGGTPGLCVDNVCACSEVGFEEALALGGGPYSFGCDGPWELWDDGLEAQKDVALDGGGNLSVRNTIDVEESAHLQLTNFVEVSVNNRGRTTISKSGVRFLGNYEPTSTVTVIDSTVEDGANIGTVFIERSIVHRCIGTNRPSTHLSLTSSTLTSTDCRPCGTVRMLNTTAAALRLGYHRDRGCGGDAELIHTTVGQLDVFSGAEVRVRASIVTDCVVSSIGAVASLGYNIESGSDTCGFDHETDQVNVAPEELLLGDLGDNGGPTQTHALELGSVAIDQIPADECVDADGAPLTTDQRGVGRPQGDSFDVGAFEAEVTP